MSAIEKYGLRLERKRRLIRAFRRGRQDLRPVHDRTRCIKRNDILLFATIRNEAIRLPFFLDYYRELGVDHFIFVDNGSSDRGAAYLAEQPDISIWHSDASYKRAGYGVHWVNHLMGKYARGHWCLVVDVDEFFVYPHCDTRPLRALTDWLDAGKIRSFGTMLLDLYPDKAIEKTAYAAGENPIQSAPFFDSGNYMTTLNKRYENLWIQGGSRQRVFFPDKPQNGPALNKIPLVKWSKGNVFVSSTHTLLPRSLNRVYDRKGGQNVCGILLHTKFLEMFDAKVREEGARKQHYAASREYEIYLQKQKTQLAFFTPHSLKYQGWQQLEKLGLMHRAGWL